MCVCVVYGAFKCMSEGLYVPYHLCGVQKKPTMLSPPHLLERECLLFCLRNTRFVFPQVTLDPQVSASLCLLFLHRRTGITELHGMYLAFFFKKMSSGTKTVVLILVQQALLTTSQVEPLANHI